MKKPALLALAAACSLFLIAVPRMAQAGVPCVRKEFRTTTIKDACTKGGQDEAKKVMKKFLSTAKAKNPSVTDCKSCHSALSPNYPLTPDALEKFKIVGGK
jgi:Fe-S oxidoreductase